MSQYPYFWLLSKGKGWYKTMWINKNRRKGFTMVELVVVLAIIGVLMAIIIPMVAGSGKDDAANAKAKSFFYATQNVFMNYKTDKPEIDMDDTGNTTGYFSIINDADAKQHTALFEDDFYFIEAEAKTNEGFTKVTVGLYEGSTSIPAAEQYKCLSKALSQNAPSTYRRQEITSGSILDSLNNFSNSEDTGYYYALVDYKCRVIATYWSSEPISVLSDNTTGEFKKDTIQFIDNNKIDYTIVGAFPEDRGSAGDVMFYYEYN